MRGAFHGVDALGSLVVPDRRLLECAGRSDFHFPRGKGEQNVQLANHSRAHQAAGVRPVGSEDDAGGRDQRERPWV